MTKVNADHTASLCVNHEVGEMPITNAQNPVTNAEHSMRAAEMGPQRKEGFRCGTHPYKSTSENKHSCHQFNFRIRTNINKLLHDHQ